jgi:broad specificity phosphatase PhoE
MNHRITLLRHGVTTANVESVIQGQLDYPLSDVGVAQARALAAAWREAGTRFDLIVSSPLLRARKTAEILAEALGISVEFEEAWQERRLGEAEGRPGDETIAALEEFPTPYEPLFRTGESEWDLFVRAAAAVQRLVRRPPGAYLVVAHGAILNAALRSILGVPPRGRAWPTRFVFDNTGYAVLEYESDRGRWTLERLNETSHLRSLEAGR